MNNYNKQTVGERSANLISRELRLDDGETDYLARSIDAILKRELAIVNKEKDELLAELPLSTNRTRWEARELLGQTSKHVDGFNGWHGCVEIKKASEVVDLLIGEKEAIQKEVVKLSDRVKELEKIPDDYETTIERETREALEYEAEGDMYGWNFHMGKKSGIIAGNIYYRDKVDELVKENNILNDKLSNATMSYMDLRIELEAVKKERDLAILHDSQPYPTPWAYEQVCEDKNKYEKELKESKDKVEELYKVIHRLEDLESTAATSYRDSIIHASKIGNLLEEKNKELEAAKNERDAWEDSAAQFHRNSEWLRGLLEETGKMLGYKCYTCDDGTIMDEPFVSKVPELVSELIDSERRLLDKVINLNDHIDDNDETIYKLEKERKECIDMINTACLKAGFDTGDQDVELWRHVDSWHARAWDYWKNKHEENKHDFKVVREQADLYYKALQDSGNIIQELTRDKKDAWELLREIRDGEVNPEDEADKFIRDRDNTTSELSKAVKNVEKYKDALKEALGMMSPPFDFEKFQELSVLAYGEASTWKEGNELKAVITDDLNCKYFNSLTK